MQRRMLFVLLSGLVASFCAFGQEIDFGINTATGQYTYASGGTLSTTSDVSINTIGSAGNPNNPVMAISSGELSFTTGSNTGGWTWGPGGTLSITGCVTGVANACTGGAGTPVVFTATFDDASIIYISGKEDLDLSDVEGTINAGIATALGVSQTFTSSQLSLAITIPGTTAGNAGTFGFTNVKTDTSASSSYTVYTSAVPEDWSLSSALGFFAFGLVAFVVARRFDLVKTAAL